MATATVSPAALEPASEPSSPVSKRPKKVNARKAAWTPERRAALAEKMRKIQAAKHQQQEVVTDADVLIAHLDTPTPEITGVPMQSPFALTDEHEFPDGHHLPAGVDRVDVYSNPTSGTPTLIDSIPVPPPALPGTPLSSYRRCPCLAVLPGRVCTFCYGMHWTKLCAKCDGEGRIHLSVRKGAERSQPCGHCGGRGTLPANMKEISEATRLAEEFAASPSGHSLVIDDPASAQQTEFRRAVKLPGIGVTATKRVNTLAARRRERERNEERKQKRAGSAAPAN